MRNGRTNVSTTSAFLAKALLWSIAIAGVTLASINALRAPGPDYLQFWTIGRAMPLPSYDTLHRQEIPAALRADPAIRYALDAGNDQLFLTATPLYYTTFALVSGASFSRALRLFQVATLLVFLGGLIVMLRMWGYAWQGVALVLGLLCWFAAPLYDDITHGNVSRLYVGTIAVVLWMFRRPDVVGMTAGARVLLALLVCFKPLAVLAAPALLLVRMTRWQWTRMASDAGGLLAGALLAFLLPSWLLGAPARLWSDFWRIQTGYVGGGDYQARGINDASLVEGVMALLHVSWPQLAAILAAAAASLIAVAGLIVARRVRAREPRGARGAGVRADEGDVDLAVLLGSASFLLVSPLVWPHYYLLAIVLALFLWRRAMEDRAPRWRRMQLAVLVAALVLLAGDPRLQFEALFLGTWHLRDVSVLESQFGLGNLIVCGAALLQYGRRWRTRGEAH